MVVRHDEPADSSMVKGARSILDAASSLFAEHGFEGTSMAKIAKKAGVCKANVFHHFASKDDLYLEVAKAAGSTHAEYIQNLLHATHSSQQKIRLLVKFTVTHMVENPQTTRLLLREISDHRRIRVRRFASNEFQRTFIAMCDILRQGIQRQELVDTVDVAVTALVICGAAQCFFGSRESLSTFHNVEGLETATQYADRVAEIILGGIVIHRGLSIKTNS